MQRWDDAGSTKLLSTYNTPDDKSSGAVNSETGCVMSPLSGDSIVDKFAGCIHFSDDGSAAAGKT